MADIRAFSAVAKSLEEKNVAMLIARVLALHESAGFDYQGREPNVRYEDSAKDEAIFESRVRYEPDRGVVHVNLRALRGLKTPITQSVLLDSPALTGVFLPGNEDVVKKTSDQELYGLLSGTWGKHLAETLRRTDHPDGWLSKSERPNEVLATRLILGGIEEHFYRLAVPQTETTDEHIWEQYDEDPALGKQGNARDWFESRGGCLIVGPILERYPMPGLRYLLREPLRIDRHLSLKEVPTYRDNALRALAEGKS